MSKTGFTLDRHGNEIPRRCRNRSYRFELSHGYVFSLFKRYDREDSPYVAVLTGTLFSSSGEEIGVFNADIIELIDLRWNGEPLGVVCDVNQHIMDMYEGVLAEGKALSFVLDDPEGDLLHLAKLKIDPAHRGKRLGLEICAAVIARFAASCAYAVMKPFPLQWVGEVNGDSDKERAMRRDRAKLIQYYAPLGFRRASPNRDYWVREIHRKPHFPGIIVPKSKR